MKVAVFPGSFDPITWGHIDLIKRSLAIFDKVVVLVAKNKSKKYLLSDVERFSLTKDVISSLNFLNVFVDRYSGFIVDYALINSIKFIVRGIRAFNDFDIEFERYLINNKLNFKIDTIFLPSSAEHLYVRSEFVKELMMKKDVDLSHFVPELVFNRLKSKFIDK